MKLTYWLDAVHKRVARLLHLDEQDGSSGSGPAIGSPDSEWVIVYRTARGFCCLYHGVPVDFPEMLDVQIWSEEMGVRTYFIGL